MKTGTKILITWGINVDLYSELQQQFPEVEFEISVQHQEIQEKIKDADIVYAGSLNQQHFSDAQQLKWVHLIGHGADAYLFPEMRESSVKLTNSGQVHSIPMAEHVFALMLNHSRKIVEIKDGQRGGRWIKQDIFPHLSELNEKTIAIVGIGNIGAEVAKRAKAFGMKVLGVRRNPDAAHEFVDEMYSLNDLERVIGSSDYIVLTLPGTKETIGLIGKQELTAMKESSYIINVGRGNVFREEELIDALKNRSIAGAGLDVFITEPLPSDSPFYSLDNVFLSPHVSGATPVSAIRTVRIFMDNLRRFLDGNPLHNVVDKKSGY